MIKKILATLITCFILVALIVIFYWRDTQYLPESADLINYFLILPVVITFILLSPWLIYKGYQTYKERKEQALAAEQNNNQAEDEQAPIAQASKWLNVNLYSAAVYNALGENDAILTGIKEFASPKLDPHLLSFQGLPILSYRIEELD
ncbi:MAG: hypothetical protein LBQ29_10920, partial [Acinetobacter sp.]|nr:hypothetical protein [Acinetobacter sp.]